MNWLWCGIEISVNLIEVSLFLYLMNSKFPKKIYGKFPFSLALIVGTAGLTCIGIFKIKCTDFLFLMCVVYLYALLARKGKPLLKLFWSFIGIAIICAIALFCISLGLLLPGVTSNVMLLEQNVTRLQLLIICKLIQAIIFFFLTKHRSVGYLTSTPIIVTFIILTATSILTEVLLMEYGLRVALSLISQFLLVCSSMIVLIINLAVLFFYNSLSKQAENTLLMQAELQRYDMLICHYEEIKGMYDEMRGWQHDYHNHLQVLHGYLQMEEYDKLESYIQEIENSVGIVEMQVNSGNILIDAIVSSKFLLARKQNIQTSVNIHVPPVLGINDTDLCILLGNLLDNAIEACQHMIGLNSKRFIEIDIKTIKGHLDISVRNSTNGIVRMLGSKFLSDKKERYHGIGIRHIDEITEKYEGYVSRKHENCVFETNIMFPIKQECKTEMKL